MTIILKRIPNVMNSYNDAVRKHTRRQIQFNKIRKAHSVLHVVCAEKLRHELLNLINFKT